MEDLFAESCSASELLISSRFSNVLGATSDESELTDNNDRVKHVGVRKNGEVAPTTITAKVNRNDFLTGGLNLRAIVKRKNGVQK